MASPTIGGICYDTANPAHRLTVPFTVNVNAITATSGGVQTLIASRSYPGTMGVYSINAADYVDTPIDNQFSVEYNRNSTPGTITPAGPFPWDVSPRTINPHVA